MYIILIFVVALAALIFINLKQFNNFKRLAPNEVVNHDRILLNWRSRKQFDKPVHYIAIDKQRRVLFPENSNKRYYLVDVKFADNIQENTEVQGRTGSAIVGWILFRWIGAIVGASRKKKVTTTTTEKNGVCYLTLTDTNFENTISLELICKTNFAGLILQDYMLTQAEVNHLQNKKVVNVDSSIEDKLTQLKSLLDKELITQDDYDEQKNKILNS
jgi:hypothetical protein